MPALLLARQTNQTSNGTTATTGRLAPAGVSAGELVGAVVVPIVLVLALMTIFVVCRRRRRMTGGAGRAVAPSTTTASGESRSQGWLNALRRAFVPEQPGSSAAPPSGASSNPRERRGRRERLRRTDSGQTVKTLPEYNDLGEDEILLYKSADAGVSPAGMEEAVQRSSQRSSRRGARGSSRTVAVQTGPASRSTSPSDVAAAEQRGARRQSSLSGLAADGLSALRRLSLRRTETGAEEASEMADMLEGGRPASPVEAIPEENTPQYEHLYPTLPPQIQVQEHLAAPDIHEPSVNRTGGALRNLFRRTGTNAADTAHRRAVSANSLSADLALTPTRSDEASFYRPSTSSSFRHFLTTNGSSASLLSQTAVDTDSPSRSSLNSSRHARNISAPISTRRLHFAPPAAGFSDKQMHFLTSVESLDKYGIPVADNGQGSPLPPSFEQLARAEEATTSTQPGSRLAPLLTSAEVHTPQEHSSISPLVSPEAAQSGGENGP